MEKTSKIAESELILQKAGTDLGIRNTHRKCTLNAPTVLENSVSLDTKVHISEVFTHSFNIDKTHRRICKNTESLLKYGKPLLTLGGDHSISYPILKAIAEKSPSIKVLWVDSHLDRKKPLENYKSHDVVTRSLIEQNIIENSNIAYYGISEVDHDENVPNKKIKTSLSEVREFCEGNDQLYVSVDIDVLQGVEGTGYPDGKKELKDINQLLRSVDPDHADFVEAAPELDETDQTLNKSTKIIRSLSQALIN